MNSVPLWQKYPPCPPRAYARQQPHFGAAVPRLCHWRTPERGCAALPRTYVRRRMSQPLDSLAPTDSFARRHTGADAAGATEIERMEVGPVPTVLVAETVTGKVPNTVGVPLMSPEAELSVSPFGRPVAL